MRQTLSLFHFQTKMVKPEEVWLVSFIDSLSKHPLSTCHLPDSTGSSEETYMNQDGQKTSARKTKVGSGIGSCKEM